VIVMGTVEVRIMAETMVVRTMAEIAEVRTMVEIPEAIRAVTQVTTTQL